MLLGPGCPSTGLSTLVRPSFATSLPPALDMKPYMPFSFDPSPISMLSGFSNMDPVQKAVLNHTFGVAPPPRKKSLIMCTICQIRFNSESQAEAHYKGNKHARRRKASESGKKQASTEESSNGSKTSKQLVKMDSASKSPADSNNKSAVQVQLALPAPKPQSNGQRADTPPTPQTSTIGGITTAKVTTQGVTSITKRPGETEEEKAKRLLYCSLCKVAVNSASQLEAHYSGIYLCCNNF
uniref:C2H2-type domain-containing protein n=1 Tax=Eptatretus burgeri TaxID=7764 RepID=A0A8C4NHF2_EPTBU